MAVAGPAAAAGHTLLRTPRGGVECHVWVSATLVWVPWRPRCGPHRLRRLSTRVEITWNAVGGLPILLVRTPDGDRCRIPCNGLGRREPYVLVRNGTEWGLVRPATTR